MTIITNEGQYTMTIDTTTILDTPATGEFYSSSGAKIHRLNDRVFIGDATFNDGANPNNHADWLTAFRVPLLGSGTNMPGQLSVLVGGEEFGATGLLAGSQSLHFAAATQSCIGAEAVVVNNHPTLATNAWGAYVEAHHTSAAVNQTFGVEIDVRTTFASQASHPYQQGTVVGLQIGAGAGVTSTGQFSASTAIEVVDNPMPWQSGIVFSSTALVGADGVSAGNANAILLGKDHALQWYGSSGVATGRVVGRGTSATNAVTLETQDAAFNVRSRGTDALQFVVGVNDNAGSYLKVFPDVAGGSPVLSAEGLDANVNLKLNAKGAASVVVIGEGMVLQPTALVRWANGATVLGNIHNRATGAAGTATPEVQLLDNGINLGSGTALGLQVSFGKSTVNNVQIFGEATGGSPAIVAVGSDTNIDLQLLGKGTGTVRFGTFTSGAPAATGFITIKASNGTVRKLLCA
jgi:hypothetical protein